MNWRSLALHWRRDRRPLRQAAARVTAQTTVIRLSQFHYHLAAHSNERVRIERQTASVPALTTPWTRVTFHHHRQSGWLSVRAAAPLPHFTRVLLMAQPARLLSPPTHARETVSLSNRSRLPNAPPAVLRYARRRSAVLFERRVNVLRVSEAERTRPLPGYSRSQTHWLPVSVARSSKEDDESVPSHTQPDRPYQFPVEQMEELVWRKRQPLPITNESGATPERVEFSRGGAVRSVATHEMPQGVSAFSERPAASLVATLDPGLLDRLTNDVIHRVEKRMRIERERRGL
ncbi:MAG: hypothetical protein HOP19_25610 [Acidobacteria bacterium]|nr:hypothetical protein [Acidobacteriota bacterium]